MSSQKIGPTKSQFQGTRRLPNTLLGPFRLKKPRRLREAQEGYGTERNWRGRRRRRRRAAYASFLAGNQYTLIEARVINGLTDSAERIEPLLPRWRCSKKRRTASLMSSSRLR